MPPLTRLTGNAMRLACAIGLLAALSTAPAAALEIKFDNFANAAERSLLQLNGSACFSDTCPGAGSALRLTPDAPGLAGSAFLRQGLAVQRDTDVAADFSFRINSAGRGPDERADGLAFVVQGGGPGFLGGTGVNLGYMHSTSPSGGYFYAVEFDTFKNGSVGDPSDNHISVTRTAGNVTEVLATVDLDKLLFPVPPMDNGEIKNVRIEFGFHGIKRNLSVFLSEGAGVTPVRVLNMVTPDDVFHFGGDSTYFGFSASTGDRFSSQDILSLTLAIPEPGSLPLLAIGCCAMLGLGRWMKRDGPRLPG
ncbi:L-type lectin-domain containing protein [Duganella sp. HH105]|uniref:L-type lectin-domain containing protein n=1 Tax=Duganella sp. HH105 TaxID=1781067 RepID=UPI000892ECF7|nr:L-type lectin-domain containing protein [Duganella sp. HH105]OEZ52501.1 legume lectin domain protein [Duganella sp. HH105]